MNCRGNFIVPNWEIQKLSGKCVELCYHHHHRNNNNNNNNINILWNQQVQAERTLPNNKPDIIIRDNEKRTCMLIDVAISGDRNVI